MQANLGVKELVGQQRISGGDRDGLRGGFGEYGPRHVLERSILSHRKIRSGAAAR